MIAMSVVCAEERVVSLYWSMALSVVMHLEEGSGLSGMCEKIIDSEKMRRRWQY
jgi:hypothetical protein